MKTCRHSKVSNCVGFVVVCCCCCTLLRSSSSSGSRSLSRRLLLKFLCNNNHSSSFIFLFFFKIDIEGRRKEKRKGISLFEIWSSDRSRPGGRDDTAGHCTRNQNSWWIALAFYSVWVPSGLYYMRSTVLKTDGAMVVVVVCVFIARPQQQMRLIHYERWRDSDTSKFFFSS